MTIYFKFKTSTKEKIQKTFFILSDNTDITSYAVFICIMINLF